MNLYQSLPVLAILALPTFLFAQPTLDTFPVTGNFGQIYRLTDTEARSIFLHPADPLPLQTAANTREPQLAADGQYTCHASFVDTFHNRYPTRPLPVGHYLLVRANGYSLDLSVYSEIDLQPFIYDNRRDFAVSLKDGKGAVLPDARVIFKGKKVPFDSKLAVYRLSRQKTGGFLEIYAGQQCVFQQVTATLPAPFWKRRWRYLQSKPVVTTLTWIPLQAGHAAKTAFQWTFMHEQWSDQRERRLRRQARFMGYIALNQPKYQPGDTVRVKAYITDRHGKPYRKTVRFRLTDSKGRSVINKKITPLTPGAYVQEIVLGDSLQLDTYHEVSFEEIMRSKKEDRGYEPGELSQDFKYEDYQLDEVSYEIKTDKSEFAPGDRVVLRLTTQDANGMPVPDAAVRIAIKKTSIYSFYSSPVFIPDTLWQYQQTLSSSVETPIEIPKTIWPDAYLYVQINAQFRNSAGEQQEKNLYLSIRKKDPVDIQADVDAAGMLNINWRLTDSTAQAPAGPVQLFTIRSNKQQTVENVYLPYRAAALPDVISYEAVYGKISTDIDGSDFRQPVQGYAGRAGDTAIFILKNPRQLPILYQVYQNSVVVAAATTTDTLFEYQVVDTKGQSLYLLYDYVWGGTMQHATQSLPVFEHLLSIQLDQPETVLPGQRVQVQVKVENAHHKPMQGVNLTAAAYNSQFDQGSREGPYTSPRISLRSKNYSFTYQQFELQDIRLKPYRNPISIPWYHALALDSLLHFRLTVPHFSTAPNASGVVVAVLNYPPEVLSGDTSAMNNPFARSEAKRTPLKTAFVAVRPVVSNHPDAHNNNGGGPILLYLNNRLVYYAGTTVRKPYCFAGETGYNTVCIRMAKGQYIIDSIWLEANQKLELAIDFERYWGQLFPTPLGAAGKYAAMDIRFVPMPDTLTHFEQMMLRQTVFQWNVEEGAGQWQQLWQNSNSVYLFKPSSNNVQLIGPMETRTDIHLLSSAAWYTHFEFEGGFEYEVAADQQRLYHSAWPKKELPPASLIPLPPVGERIWRLSDMQVDFSAPVEKPQYLSFFKQNTPHTGSLYLDIQLPKEATLWVIGLRNSVDSTKYGPLNPNNRTLTGISPGKYDVLLYQKNGTLFTQKVVIRADTSTCIRIENQLFTAPPTGQKWTDLFLWEKPDRKGSFRLKPGAFSQWTGDENGQYFLTGNIMDDTGEALIGASVRCAAGNIFMRGAITDIDGNFKILLPPGIYDLSVNYTGYSTQEITGVIVGMGPVNTVDVTMAPSSYLREVVVTAYKVPLIQQDHTSGGRTLTAQEIRNLPTRSVNHLYTMSSGIDGGDVRIRGSRSNANNYYVDGIRIGSRSVQGDDDLPPPIEDFYDITGVTGGIIALKPAPLRTKFKDYAYWQPNLITDSKGEASFTVQFPDNITSWNTYVLGMDKHRNAGEATRKTRAYKPLTAQLALPRFAVAGDVFYAVGRVTNLNNDSAKVVTAFRQGGQLLAEYHQTVGLGSSQSTRIEVPANTTDSLKLSFEVQTPQVSDGEERSIAVLPVGVQETSGTFMLLEHDTAFTLQMNPALGTVFYTVQDNALDVLLTDIQQLVDYPHGCNEQVSSRLLALLLFEKVMHNLPADHPALQFRPDGSKRTLAASVKERIKNGIVQLRRAQLDNGAWGWWESGQPNAWMTIYVLRTLHEAKQAGYSTECFERGLTWLHTNLYTLPLNDQREAITLLRTAGVNVNSAAILKKMTEQVNKPNYTATLYERLSIIRLRQLCDSTIRREDIAAYLQPTILGGIRVGAENQDWYNRRAINTLLVYDIAAAAHWEDITKGIRRYWLESRTQQPRNTVETAQILSRLLPALEQENKIADQSNQLMINGVNRSGDNIPLSTPAHTLHIEKKGNLPLYFTAYQQWQNPQPAPRSDIFSVSTHWEQQGQTVSSAALRQGEAANLLVSVEVKSAAEYVMIEVPVPAGCGYGDKIQPGYHEVHRSYYRDRTAIFCQQLPAGKYQFSIPLEVRFSGQYTINPVRVESMYFPTFYGRNGVNQVQVR